MSKVCFSVSGFGYYVYDSRCNIITTIPMEGDDEPFETELVIPDCNNEIIWGISEDEFVKRYHTQMKTLVLQVTRDCNLRCSFCVYSGEFSNMHKHQPEAMSFDTARSSIDFFMSHSQPDDSEMLSIVFYGGEPLLNFNVVKEMITYANSFGRKIKYGISTNGILLTEHIVRWLNENPNVFVTITVNGNSHDKYRINENGAGSLNTIMERLEYIRRNWTHIWENQIRIITNICSIQEVYSLRSFFRERLEKIPVSITYISMEYASQTLKNNFIIDDSVEMKLMGELFQEYIQNDDPFLALLFREWLNRIHNRGIFEDAEPGYIDSCAPLIWRMFVRTDGSINLCERVSDNLILGNVHDGFDDEKILSLFQDMKQFSNENCRDCWAQRLCTFCYQDVIDEEGGMVKRFSDKYCISKRKKILEQLKMYIQLANLDFNRLDYMNV